MIQEVPCKHGVKSPRMCPKGCHTAHGCTCAPMYIEKHRTHSPECPIVISHETRRREIEDCSDCNMLIGTLCEKHRLKAHQYVGRPEGPCNRFEPIDGYPHMCTCCWLKESHTTEAIPVMNDAVNHPSHYTSHPSGIEAIVICEHFGFNIGNTIKYLWRAGLKNDELEDLKKARWYLDREIARREKEKKT